jgi:dimethylamine monooxygenase subunit A
MNLDPVTNANPRAIPIPVESSPPYLPHLQQPEVLAMGLQSMTIDWLDPCHNLTAWHHYKVAQFERMGDDIYRVLPESKPACSELAALIAMHTGKASDIDLDSDSVASLWRASLSVPEDLVIMLPGSEGYYIAAASLCSPSHWRLRDKIGRIDRFFERLQHSRPVQRFNWSLQEDADYFAWPRDGQAPFDADTPIFYRVERQTLRRLPETGAIAFTIRVFITPLAALLNIPGAMVALLAAVDQTAPALADYKNFPRLQLALDKYRTMAQQDISMVGESTSD